MGFSSGTYTLPEAAFVFDTVISETAVNSNFSDIATALSTCLLKDGTQTVTADIPMATYHFTGVGAGSAATDSVNLGQVQANAYGYVASDTGSADAYAIAPSPAITAYAAGQRFAFIAANASTGASTVDVSGLGTKAIQYQAAALTGAEIKAGALIVVEYDGTQFQMISPSALPASVVDDTTPQLGGFLDPNGKFIGTALGTTVASVAGDTDIWANFDGNVIHISGTNAMTDLGTPKEAGDFMWCIADAACSFVDSATITCPGDTNYTCAAGDLILVIALTTSTFQIFPVPQSGSSPVAPSGSDNTEMVYGYGGATGGSGATIYMGRTDASLAGESDASSTIASSGTIKNLYCKVDDAPGASESVTYTIMVNGVASALTATISNTDKTANDTVNTVAVSAGDRLSCRAVFSGSAVGPSGQSISHQLLLS